MDTTFELVRATRGLLQGKKEYFRDIYNLAINDVYFQLQFVMCDETHITQEIEDYFVSLYKSAFMVETADNMADWINTTIHQKTADWIRQYRRDMLQAELKGGYVPPHGVQDFLSGKDLDDVDFNKVLVSFVCNLPEIHRQTALAFYYDNMPETAIYDIFMIDSVTLKNRTTFIERSLNSEVHDYCKDNHFSMKSVNSHKIRAALFELSKLYVYPYADALFENIAVRVGLTGH